MLLEGRIRVNGRAVTQLGARADAEKDSIRVDGKLLKVVRPRLVTIALNKPRGVVSTRRDPQGRRTVLDLVKGVHGRVYPVGRLDYNAEGLLLLTNDGELAYRLLRPGSVERVYRVKVKGDPDPEQIQRLGKGVVLDGRPTLPARVRRLRPGGNAWIEIGLHEGRRNQVVRMFKAIGHPVLRLRRVRIGPLALGTLRPGQSRLLTPAELAALKADRAPLNERVQGGDT